MAQDSISKADSKDHLHMWRSFLETHSTVMRYLERRMEEQHSLPLAWWDVLQQLSDGPEGRLRMEPVLFSEPLIQEQALLHHLGLLLLQEYIWEWFIILQKEILISHNRLQFTHGGIPFLNTGD